MRSVRNLLERFEKHMQAHSRKGKMVRRPERPIGNSVEELQATSKQAIESLDEICVYMLDYRAIVDEFLDHDRHQRRLQTHTGGAAAAATPLGPHTVAFSVSEGGKE
uniref:Uncharacterized protein n=1 Tax=Rhizochromulina marina TaxID=1034831 RepID=A0A7S2S5Y8_9STRA